MWEAVFFWVFASAAVGLGGLVILMKNPIYSAVALVGNMFCLAALFALQSAHFLAVLQVLVYAGAIMVLMLFVIMLLNIRDNELGAPKRTLVKYVGGAVAAWAVVLLGTLFWSASYQNPILPRANFGTIEVIGRLIFNKYLLPFEVASILLLAAVLGAVSLAKKDIW